MSKTLYDPFVDVKISGFDKIENAYQKRIEIINTSTSMSEEESLRQLKEEFENHQKIKIAYIEDTTHMPFSTISQYLTLVSDNDLVLSFRDSGPASLKRLKEGATGKGFSEKAKSAQYGKALAGYIPIQQEFSKAGGKGQAVEYNKTVRKRIEECKALLGNITTILERMNSEHSDKPTEELARIFETSEIVTSKPLLDRLGRQIYGFTSEEHKPLCYESSQEPIFATKNDDGTYVNEKNGEIFVPPSGANSTAISILAYVTDVEKIDGEWKIKVQSITGDHDQLFIGTKAIRDDVVADDHIMRKFGEQDAISIAVSTALIHDTKEIGAVKHAADSGAGSHKNSVKEDDYNMLSEHFSNSMDLTDIMQSPILQEFRTKKIGGNPYPEDFETPGKVQNYSFIVPKSDGIQEIIVVHTQEEMTPILNNLETEGYNVPINPRYGWERDKDGNLSLRSDRISAQTYKNHLENLSHRLSTQEFKKAKQDSQSMYALHEIIGLVRLQEPSHKKDEILSILEIRMNLEKEKFEKNYGYMAPLESARITSILDYNPEIQSAMRNFSKIVRTKLEARNKVKIAAGVSGKGSMQPSKAHEDFL